MIHDLLFNRDSWCGVESTVALKLITAFGFNEFEFDFHVSSTVLPVDYSQNDTNEGLEQNLLLMIFKWEMHHLSIHVVQ